MRILDNIIYRAEKFNDVKAQYQLGVIFQTGDRVEPDAEKARHWFELAADQGHEEAIRALAGMGVEPEEYQAWDDEDNNEADEEVAALPPVIDSRAKEVAVDFGHDVSGGQDCPHGHGPLQNWEGHLRCWVCGWPAQQPEQDYGSFASPAGAQPVSATEEFGKKLALQIGGLFGKTPVADAQAEEAGEPKEKTPGFGAVAWGVGVILYILINLADSCK